MRTLAPETRPAPYGHPAGPEVPVTASGPATTHPRLHGTGPELAAPHAYLAPDTARLTADHPDLPQVPGARPAYALGRADMKTQSWTTKDKAGWPDGPWQTEPDKLQWNDEATDLPCLIKRNGGGALCGYVGVPEGHPWFRREYDEVVPRPEVHGGLTYSDRCQEDGDQAETICHIPEPGEPDNVWWLGFHCGHWNDVSPAFEAHLSCLSSERTYKPLAYVQDQCALLAKQLVEVAR